MKNLILAMTLVVLLGVPVISYGGSLHPLGSTKTPTGTRVTGTLHFGSVPMGLPGTRYWLRADQPLYVLEGSKSEAETDVVVLNIPVELLEKAEKLDGRHIAVTGIMNCEGNWASGAHCDMTAKQIDIEEDVK
jgi:hypothetical protein